MKLGYLDTGNSFSEALILESFDPQCDDRLFIELQVQYKKITRSEHVKKMLCTKTKNNFCTQHVLDINLQFSFSS